MHKSYAGNRIRLGWSVLLGSWLLFGISFLLLSYCPAGPGKGVSEMGGWECANASLQAISPRCLLFSPGMRLYIAGFTAVNILGILSVLFAFIPSVRRSRWVFLLPLFAAGYALSWFFYNAWHNAVGDLRFGYYVWALSLWGTAYGLARVRRLQEHQPPVAATDENGVWPPPPIAYQ